MRIALTRPISPSFEHCELTHRQREPIDLELAERQHAAYQERLRKLGCEVHELPMEPGLPDSVFVEDTALVLEELAVLTRPGAPSRRPETTSVEQALQRWRPVKRIEKPGTLDGGDVLRLGRKLFVGASSRSNPEGIEQLRGLVQPYGYTVTAVALKGCLHLKTGVTQAGPDTLVLNPRRLDTRIFRTMRLVEVHPEEPDAANALWLPEGTIYPSETPATAERLERAGIRLELVSISELAKAEAGVTCCSLIFEA